MYVCTYLSLGRDCGNLQKSSCFCHQKVVGEIVLLFTHEKYQVVPCLFFYWGVSAIVISLLQSSCLLRGVNGCFADKNPPLKWSWWSLICYNKSLSKSAVLREANNKLDSRFTMTCKIYSYHSSNSSILRTLGNLLAKFQILWYGHLLLIHCLPRRLSPNPVMVKPDVLRYHKRAQVPLLFLFPVSWTGSKIPHVSSLCDLVVCVCRTDKNASFREEHWYISKIFNAKLRLYFSLCINTNTEELNLDSIEIKSLRKTSHQML